MPRLLAFGLTAIALGWAFVLVAAPWGLSRGGGAALGAAAVYSASSRICHQQPERSFHLDRTPLPVCGRCSGLYVSGALGALLAWGPRRRRRGRSDRLILGICAIPTAATWGLEQAGAFAFTNEIRALAALPLGLAAGWLFVSSLREEASGAAVPAPPARPGALS